MMRFPTLLRHPADWMSASGAQTSVVLTSRIRLARNVRGHAFPGWAKASERGVIYDELRPVLEAAPGMKDCFSKEMVELEMLQKQVLVERHLISREHAARGKGSGAVINRKQTCAVMINEEDHLRVQAIRPGLNFEEAYAVARSVDHYLDSETSPAFDPSLGYLTACPSNLGTGMRASVMVHLPGLVMSEHIGPALNAIRKLGFAVRGLYGEGTESLGNLFQISNQSTLGQSETGIIGELTHVIGQLVEAEEEARLKFQEDEPEILADRIGRAYGTLRHANLISSKEALNLLSLIRMGDDLSYFPPSITTECDRLFMETQPAHLQWLAGRTLDPSERDSARAEMIRLGLQNLPAPARNSQQHQLEADQEVTPPPPPPSPEP